MSEDQLSKRNQFFALKVGSIKQETADAISIGFELSDDQKELFSFIPGQYLTFKLNLDGVEHRRSYSICSGLQDRELKVSVKKLEGGLVSTHLNDHLNVGDELHTSPPQGNFYATIDPNQNKKYVGIAAGSGITPIMSIIKSVLNGEPNSTIQLLYGNSNEDSIIFNDELNSLAANHSSRFNITHFLSKPLAEGSFHRGRITAESLETSGLSNWNDVDAYFLCGPFDMIDTVKHFLVGKGVDESKIKYELFTTTDVEEDSTPEVIETDSFEGLSEVTIELDEDQTNIQLETSGPVVLQAAIDAGIDPPYSCRGGVCTSCMAKLKEGQVSMDMNHALTDDEIKDGYILTCQSHPRSAKVVISYDDV